MPPPRCSATGALSPPPRKNALPAKRTIRIFRATPSLSACARPISTPASWTRSFFMTSRSSNLPGCSRPTWPWRPAAGGPSRLSFPRGWGRSSTCAKPSARNCPACAPDCPILFTAHHQAHAASAFYPSPFTEAAILTIDGVGEWATTTIGEGRGDAIRILKELRFPHSLGLLYSAFTDYCGFRINSGEYKLMGLAPYGEPKFVDAILSRTARPQSRRLVLVEPRLLRFSARHHHDQRTLPPAVRRAAPQAGRKHRARHMDVARSDPGRLPRKSCCGWPGRRAS